MKTGKDDQEGARGGGIVTALDTTGLDAGVEIYSSRSPRNIIAILRYVTTGAGRKH